jgi:GTP-binding protein LepA
MVKYDLPLNEVVFDFYDRLKSISKGYASFDYRPHRLQAGGPGEDVRSWSTPSRSMRCRCWSTAPAPKTRGRAMVEKMKDLIPPHMFQIPIQAAIGGKIIARETVRALRKDVTAKCYGGDASRKKQASGEAEGRQEEACASSARSTSRRKRSSPR